jgi:biofilm PGA synthesis lipoprotein PgaB
MPVRDTVRRVAVFSLAVGLLATGGAPRATAVAAGIPGVAATQAEATPRAASAGRPFPLVAILCYHDLSRDPGAPLQSVSPEFLRDQIRACKADGWTFLPLSALLAQRDHPERLPPRVMVLTFDDGYRSFAELALPILRAEGVTATLAVVTSFVDRPPADLPPLLKWGEIVRLAAAGDAEIASHSHALHRYETSNPYRDTGPSVSVRRYLLAEGRYENREEYRSRIGADLLETQRLLRDHLGRAADALVWPYGMHNEMARGLAARAGFSATLGFGWRPVSAADLRSGSLPRIMVTRRLRFAGRSLAWLHPPDAAIRAAQVDLDDLWDPDERTFRARLDRTVLRARELGATHVFLQACADPQGDGRIAQAWAMNHQLPTRADVWSMAAAKFAAARLRVWVRAPATNLAWVRERHPDWGQGGIADSALAGTRLDPALPEARRAAVDFLTDLAVYLPFDGVLFDDGAVMAPRVRAARGAARAGDAVATRELIEACKAAVRAWRPDCRFACSIDAGAVEANGTRGGFEPELEACLREDDLTVVRVYPWMRDANRDSTRWAGRVARRAIERWKSIRPPASRSGGDPAPASSANVPVLLMLEAYDWKAGRWIPAGAQQAMATAALRAGIAHLGSYPVAAAGELPVGLLEAGVQTDRGRTASGPQY